MQEMASTPDKMPVIVFLHGGSFVTGAGSEVPAEGVGINFPAKGVLLVSVNFRLGALGSLLLHRTPHS